MIILVTGTHQYFIHNTLGRPVKGLPLPRRYRLLQMQEPFFRFHPGFTPFHEKTNPFRIWLCRFWGMNSSSFLRPAGCQSGRNEEIAGNYLTNGVKPSKQAFQISCMRYRKACISAPFRIYTASIIPRTPERYRISNNTTDPLPRGSGDRRPGCGILPGGAVCAPLWPLLLRSWRTIPGP